jgi:RHS repeat-associated protein
VAFDDVELYLIVGDDRSGNNLAPTPGFEDDTGWSTVANFAGTSFYRSTWGTASPHWGTHAYVISNHVYGYLLSNAILSAPGRQYVLSAWVRGELDAEDSEGYWRVRLYFYNSGGVEIGWQDVAYGGPGTLTTTWTQKYGLVTTPAGTASVRILLHNYMNSGWVAYDDVSLQPAYNLTYDYENRLTAVSGAAVATFTYDGDGNRVQATENNATTTYVGNYYEYFTQSPTVAPLKSGIACQDGATGSGYLMYSAENLFTRFVLHPPHPDNAEHFICVIYDGSTWEYDNNDAYYAFTPVDSDILVASVNFTNDTVTSLVGQDSVVNGIVSGYYSGDLTFTPNQYGGDSNPGEFGIGGTNFTPNRIWPAPINYGVACQDSATGSGYILYSAQNVFTRFAAHPPEGNNADHFVCVIYDGTNWKYDNNDNYFVFSPVDTDILVASVNFTNDTATNLAGQYSNQNGIALGYSSGDLTFTPNRYGGASNNGEFEIGGTYFKPNRPAIWPAPLNSGVACQDTATGSGYILYSAESVFTRFAAHPPDGANADHFICAIYTGGVWQYDNNNAYYTFTPAETDILVASVNFTNDTVTSLAGQNQSVGGIASGYYAGDLTFIPNQYGGSPNTGEFQINGTRFTPNQLVSERFYYYAGEQRIGMRVNGTLYWLLSDHLGNTSVTADANGVKISERGYKPWGEERSTSGITPTGYGFTGQHESAEIGLYYYGARWYDSYLNRWISPDSIIPDPGNSIDLDRYAYARNNPLRYKDPSGHLVCSDKHVAGEDCSDEGAGLWRFRNIVSTSGNWTREEKESIRQAVVAAGMKISTVGGGHTSWEAFERAYGHVTFTKSSEAGNYCQGGSGTVTCYSGTDVTSGLLVHELGHTFSWAHNLAPYERLEDADAQIVDDRGFWVTGTHPGGEFERTTLGYKSGGIPDMYHGPEDFNDWNSNVNNVARNEDYADMFENWVYHGFDYSPSAYNAGTYRDDWMTTNVAEFVR